MGTTVFFTILAGVITYVAGQLILKLVIEPVQELRRTIGNISYTLIERANVIHNPGVPTIEVINETSKELRKLSSQLHSHFFLIPLYDKTSKVFRLPSHSKIREAATNLIGLSNGIHEEGDNIYEVNAKRIEKICDCLGIYLSDDERWPK